MRDQETGRGRMAYQSLVDPPLNESRSSQLSGLGAGIPSLVGAFGSKVIKCGAGSSLSTQGRAIEGTQTLDLFSMAGGVSFVSIVFWGGQGRRIGSRGDAYASSLSIGFPSFAVSGEGDKGEGPNHFVPQPPCVIRFLNSLFLFTSTMRATTSSPFTSQGKGERATADEKPATC